MQNKELIGLLKSQFIQSILFCSELRREKAWSRIHLVPILMAEADRDTYRREQAQLAREKEIMKDVKGWEVSIQIFINLSRLSHL